MVCTSPFGLPVDPDVKSVKSGSSLFIATGGHSVDAEPTTLLHSRSRLGVIGTWAPVRCTISTLVTESHPFASA